ncbi:hypothetical protein [Sinorhizobium americanum]|uniref:Uncharacterized protein n=1 Tax=Sinorhizobium americanum TaxID=194963 RepID=A0A1L3LKI8_9HYPH|nr:hypothetical protein [Sinorhizobium americanum]APG84045.1 hypothetical protein SAMCCGM7_Ch1275 [Sinorhizobium americanum CCGM7]APG90597.1 hypothetical protein SAMCFNEI73_Ch1285 [Sinorhizobium americanum]OAP48070.1 hypothetical protein ATC00_21430 [Sinorhizobium americanum]TCN30988.1 hypothetical protein EV184_107287 [Sinorhizobium americanum]
MNRIATFSVIAALSTLSFGGITYATDAKMNWPSHIDQSVRAFKGDNVRIVDVDTLKEENQTRMWIDEASAEQRAALLAAVEANKPLATKLKAQNVEMNNIAGAEEAADGGLTIYVR